MLSIGVSSTETPHARENELCFTKALFSKNGNRDFGAAAKQR